MITPEQRPLQAIIPETVNVHGIELKRAKITTGAPKKESFTDYVEDGMAVEMQQKVAKAWLMDEPVLLEGGTSLGKTRTVLKMCSDLGYEAHKLVLSRETDRMEILGSPTVNPDQGTKTETGETDERKFIIVLSQLVKAIQPEDGKIKVCIVDEFNSAMPGVVIRLHEILDAYKFNSSELVFAELGGLKVKIDRSKVKFVALMNPPGNGYSDRNQIDPANLRRWVYQKLPNSMPEDVLRDSIDTVFGLDSKAKAETSVTPILNNKEALPLSEFENIKGIREILPQYLAFHESIKAQIGQRQIANGQPQRFTFDDREEPRRVRNYIAQFYRGDINETMQEALRYIYGGKITDDTEKAKVEEIIRKVAVLDSSNKDRKGLAEHTAESQPIPSDPAFWQKPDIQSIMDKDLVKGVESSPGIINLETKGFKGKTATQLIDQGKYDDIGSYPKEYDRPEDKITSDSLEVTFLNPTKSRKTTDIKAEMDRLGVRPLNAHELYALGIKYPELQRKQALIALGSAKTFDGGTRFPYLWRDGSGRKVFTGVGSDDWNDICRFPVVRK